MSEMVERVAEAIYFSRQRNKPWVALGQHKVIYLKAARAAIEAMREPSDAMLMVSQGVFMNPGNGYKREGSDWDRIIDAALTPSPTSES
jgi:hypothetical protein